MKPAGVSSGTAVTGAESAARGQERRSLVINADDFGFTPPINRGVIDAFERGVVTAVSMMVRQPGWRDAVHYASSVGPALDVGLHINVSVGAPITRARSLIDDGTGGFLPVRALVTRSLARRVRADDVYVECVAQAEQIAQAGLTVTHLDGHRHLHLLPGVWEGVVMAAEALGNIPIRVPRERTRTREGVARHVKRLTLNGLAASAVRRLAPPVEPLDFAGGTLHGDHRYLARVRSIVAALPAGISELMTHPGYASGSLPGGDVYDTPRELELRALTSTELRECLVAEGVVLTNFCAHATNTSHD